MIIFDVQENPADQDSHSHLLIVFLPEMFPEVQWDYIPSSVENTVGENALNTPQLLNTIA